MAAIAGPDLFVCSCQTWIYLDITCFYEEQRQHGRLAQNGKSGHHCWGREVSAQFAQQFVTAVTAPPPVGSAV